MSDPEGTPQNVLNVLRVFLEGHPLYAACRFETSRDKSWVWLNADHWPAAITLTCRRCKRETTWTRANSVFVPESSQSIKLQHFFYENSCVLCYICASCSYEHAGFWCSIESTAKQATDADRVTRRIGTAYCVRKQGQSPAWSIEPVAAVAKALPSDAAEFYRKGLICTSHNFGLGAVGYFRRVVESVTGHLLDLVEEHAKEVGDQATVDGIAKARRDFPATERLKHAANLLPPALRPGGANPLANLYEKYSEGIHSLSDEECLDVARTLQAILDYLLPSLHDQLSRARAFQAAMEKSKRLK